MTRIVHGATMMLTGDVGDLGDGADHFTLNDARSGLAEIGRQRATVRLNSGGGDASVGIAVASLFSAHPGGVECIVEGVAASAASAAACGASRIVMSLGSVWMLDEARAVTLGTAEDHAASVAELDTINSSLASVYARRTGQTPQAMAALMAAETWMTADDAVAAGFADAVLGQGAVEPAAFAYQARYQHPPAALLDRRPWAKTQATPQPTVALDEAPLTPKELAELCIAAEQPEMIVSLLDRAVTLPQARARLDVLATIRPMMMLARGQAGVTEDLMARALSGRLTIAQAREALFDAMATASEAEETQVDHRPRTGNGTADADGRTAAKRSMQKIVAQKYGTQTQETKR